VTRQRFRSALAIVTVFAGAIAAPVLVTSPANAATSYAEAQASTSVSSTTTSTLGGTIAVAPPVIACTLTVDNPHTSSHVRGNVNVLGRFVCTAPVASLNTTLVLFRNGVAVASNANGNRGTASLSNRVSIPCVDGSYHASMKGIVVFPPGFLPPFDSVTKDSNTVQITCFDEDPDCGPIACIAPAAAGQNLKGPEDPVIRPTRSTSYS
jgi:hypothetical protein